MLWRLLLFVIPFMLLAGPARAQGTVPIEMELTGIR